MAPASDGERDLACRKKEIIGPPRPSVRRILSCSQRVTDGRGRRQRDLISENLRRHSASEVGRSQLAQHSTLNRSSRNVRSLRTRANYSSDFGDALTVTRGFLAAASAAATAATYSISAQSMKRNPYSLGRSALLS